VQKLKSELFKFDPHKSFVTLPIFWVTVGTILSIAFLISLVIYANENLHFDFTAKGFNGFLNIFKLPLGISALIIPIVALLAANHRSEQTKAQILTNKQQNMFSNYYKHIEEFEKYVELINSRKTGFSVPHKRNCHKRLFPKAAKGEFSICEVLFQNIHNSFAEIETLIHYFHGGHKTTPLETIFNIEHEFDKIFSFANCSWAQRSGVQLNFNGSQFVTAKNMVAFMNSVKLRADMFMELISFDQSSGIPRNLIIVASIDPQRAPNESISVEGNYVHFNPFV